MSDLLVEVNEVNKIIGTRPLEEFINAECMYRASAVIIMSDEGEILVQKRKNSATLYSAMFDFPIFTPVYKGETNEAALSRGMKETLGLDVHTVEVVSYLAPKSTDQAFITLYVTYTEGPFRLLGEDLESVEWMSVNWLQDSITRRPDRFTARFVEGLSLYLDKYGNVEHTLSSIE